ncbi:MAG: hypothetical protein IMZ55_11040, partial [Acidobacteria bacterium]|nr:hypothetical protein [Acidobacteriota bacterium]
MPTERIQCLLTDTAHMPVVADSVIARSEDGTYGVRRQDNGAVVVIAGTAFAVTSPGVYTLAFTPPASALTYEAVAEVTEAGETYWIPYVQRGETWTTASLLVAAAAAVRAFLAALGLPGPPTITRRWLPVVELKDLVQPRFSVVPISKESSILGRDMLEALLTVDVGIQYPLLTGDEAELDSYMDLTENIAGLLMREITLADLAVTAAAIIGPDRDHLQLYRVWTS